MSVTEARPGPDRTPSSAPQPGPDGDVDTAAGRVPTLVRAIPELALVGAAVLLFVVAGDFDYSDRPGQLGPRFWPQVLCVGLGLSALVRLVQKLRPRATPGAPATPADGDEPQVMHWRRFAVAIALVVGYVIATIVLGYPIATALFLLGFLWIGGQRRWWVPVLAAGFALVFSYVFLGLVYISLPTGIGIFDDFTVELYQLLGIY